jgi:hypothetical protein
VKRRVPNASSFLNGVAFAAASLLVLGHIAHAATPSQQFEGRNCTVADRGSDVWFGYFKGKHKVFSPLKGGDTAKDFTSWRCFVSETECSSWQNGMDAKFDGDSTDTFCRQGG